MWKKFLVTAQQPPKLTSYERRGGKEFPILAAGLRAERKKGPTDGLSNGCREGRIAGGHASSSGCARPSNPVSSGE
jgi:hypothetical protein